MTAQDRRLEAEAARRTATLTRALEIAQHALVAAGWDPKYRLALVLEYDGDPERTAFVSNIDSTTRVREIVDHYARQEQETERMTARAISKMRGKDRG